MITFESVELCNFKSYERATIDLKERGVCLIHGKNFCRQDNSESNGSGKSTIADAVCFALTGETVAGVSKGLARLGAEENIGYVRLSFNLGGHEYQITRYVSPKSDMKIRRDGEDISGKGIKESSAILQKLLPDMDREFLASTTIIGQGMPCKFSSFSPAGRKALLEKLTKTDFMIDDIKKRLQNRLDKLGGDEKKIKADIDSIKLSDGVLKARAEALSRTLERLKNTTYEVQLEDTSKELETKQGMVESVSKSLGDVEKSIDTFNSLLLEANSNLSALKDRETKDYSERVKKLYDERSEVSSRKMSVEAEIRRIQSIKDVCPTCGQKIPGVIKPTTEKQESERRKLAEKLDGVDRNIKEAEREHNENIQSIVESFSQSTADSQQRLRDKKSERDRLTEEKSRLEKSIAELKARVKYLSDSISSRDSDLKSTETDLKGVNSSLEKNSKDMEKKSRELDDVSARIGIDTRINTLATRDLRGYLLNNVISYMDRKAKEYSKVVFGHENISVCAEGNNLNIDFSGKSFDSLSGGEKQRVDIILQLVLKDMLSQYFGVETNIIFLDEITDFLDRKSCDAVMKLIGQKLTNLSSIFVISHRVEELDLQVDSEIDIIKNTDGVSEIE